MTYGIQDASSISFDHFRVLLSSYYLTFSVEEFKKWLWNCWWNFDGKRYAYSYFSVRSQYTYSACRSSWHTICYVLCPEISLHGDKCYFQEACYYWHPECQRIGYVTIYCCLVVTSIPLACITVHYMSTLSSVHKVGIGEGLYSYTEQDLWTLFYMVSFIEHQTGRTQK